MPDTQAIMADNLPPALPVLKALMQEIIPKSSRYFILTLKGIVKPSRLPIVTYKKKNVHLVMPNLHTEACHQNFCWGASKSNYFPNQSCNTCF